MAFILSLFFMKYCKVLTIAGSDSCGGAGIQADLKTFSALGCYGMSVITAITAQNTNCVSSVHGVPSDFVTDQLTAVLSDIDADAVKIGMLYSVEVIESVARQLREYSVKNIVLDPVMVAQSGGSLLQDEALDAVKNLLMPLAAVVTPNIPEASVLVNHDIDSPEDMRKATLRLASCGAGSILLKGGHLTGEECNDLLYICSENRFVEFKAERISTRNNHGTGCTLSSAIASYLAKGFSTEKSVKYAKEYVLGAIRAGREYETGSGHGPLHHFYKFWP